MQTNEILRQKLPFTISMGLLALFIVDKYVDMKKE